MSTVQGLEKGRLRARAKYGAPDERAAARAALAPGAQPTPAPKVTLTPSERGRLMAQRRWGTPDEKRAARERLAAAGLRERVDDARDDSAPPADPPPPEAA